MKKAIFSVFLAFLFVFIAGCASTSGANASSSTLPWWCGTVGARYSTRIADTQPLRNRPVESGYFFCGMSEDLGSFEITAQAANMAARTEVARNISIAIADLQYKENSSQQAKAIFREETQNSLSRVLTGIQIVESFEDEKKGRYYSLAFISEKNLKLSLSRVDSQDIKKLSEELLLQWKNE